jgi:3-hydroxymyristoyl/3-hydroxydecanoyl-(acyl carrier protein) dehydratase
LEVYGSTETSGIAYRQSKNGPAWTPFDNALISKNSESCLVVRSPYIRDPAGFVTGDLVDILEDGRFILMGRADDIVKIEEKRISLTEVEHRILQSGYAADVAVIALEGRRQYLAAALVLNEAGKEHFRDCKKHMIDRYFREYLLRFFESIFLPKKWRYLEALPLDAQGKKKRHEIRALFMTDSAALFNDASEGGQVLKKDDASVTVDFFIPQSSEYFDGHFPDFKVFPAVAQLDMVIRLSARYFSVGIQVREAKRIKFSHIIHPDTPVQIRLDYCQDLNRVSFTLKSPGGDRTYSSGTLFFERKP